MQGERDGGERWSRGGVPAGSDDDTWRCGAGVEHVGRREGDEEAAGEAAFQAAWGGVATDEGEMEATGGGVGRGSVEEKARGRGGGARRRWVARTRRQGPSAVGRFVPPILIWIGEGKRGVRSWGGGERSGASGSGG